MLVTSTNVNSTSIVIQWERVACEQRNGEIEGYNVTYYPQNNDDASEKINATVFGITESNRTYLASGLQPRTNYTFEVKAFNSGKLGPATRTTIQTSVSNGKLCVQISYSLSFSIILIGIGFFLNGQLYSNNSIVILEEIGEEKKALLCLTNNISCCNVSQGDWYSPDDVKVTARMTIDDNATGFYTSRGPSFISQNKITGTSGIFPVSYTHLTLPTNREV